MRWMEACYGGTDVMERSCAVARGIDINIRIPTRSPTQYSLTRDNCHADTAGFLTINNADLGLGKTLNHILLFGFRRPLLCLQPLVRGAVYY
jgi:hypothetical protein